MDDKLELNMQARIQWNKVARTRRDISHFGISVNFDSGPLLIAVVEHWDLRALEKGRCEQQVIRPLVSV